MEDFTKRLAALLEEGLSWDEANFTLAEERKQKERREHPEISISGKHDVVVKRYGDVLRIIAWLHGRPESWHVRREPGIIRGEDLASDDGPEGRELCNIARSRGRIRELALCNQWDYFVTLTLSPEWGDRRDLPRWRASLSHWLRDLRRRTGANIQYLFVPEEHKAGGWHMHGLVRGIPAEMLRPFTLRERLPNYLRGKLSQGYTIYDWPAYRARYGFVDLEPIRDSGAVSAYITKYVSKALADLRIAANAHSFYASQGLAGAEEVVSGCLDADMCYDWHNDYIGILDRPVEGWLDALMEMIIPGESVRDIREREREMDNAQLREVWRYAEMGRRMGALIDRVEMDRNLAKKKEKGGL